jgi:hypothetical protein
MYVSTGLAILLVLDKLLRNPEHGFTLSPMRKGSVPAVIACCLVAASAAGGQGPSSAIRPFIRVDSPAVALTHVRVIDGTGAPARDDQTVVFVDGRIASVADAGAATIPSGAQVLDLPGYTVIPGLVGMHDHMFYPVGGALFGEMAYS